MFQVPLGDAGCEVPAGDRGKGAGLGLPPPCGGRWPVAVERLEEPDVPWSQTGDGEIP